MNIPIVQLNGGEFSPKIETRSDTEKYRSGCRHLENMIPLIQGPVERRQGTKYIYKSTAATGEPNMSFSDYLENKILNHLFDGTAYTAPTIIYVALSTTYPGDSGADKTEPSGFGYARQATTSTTWNTATTGTTTNAVAITFPEATGAWGTITHYVLMDALTAGNVLASGELDVDTEIVEGDILTFAISSITITLD